MTICSYSIGTTLIGITNLESLTIPVRPPKHTFSPHAEDKKLVSGLVMGLGWPTATWNWAAITSAERASLRTFCTGSSAWVYMRTRTNEVDTTTVPGTITDVYRSFYAVMVWPDQKEEYDSHHRLNFVINFQNMIEQAEPEPPEE
jgi:hypothetical protein